MSDLSRMKFGMARLLVREGNQPLTAAMDAAGQTPGGVLLVSWNQITGGGVEPVSGAQIGGVETPMSGTLPAIAVEENARTVLRQFQEIQAGDLIVDLPPNPQIVLFLGQAQSGVLPLSGVAPCGPRFQWAGNPGVQYVQANVGEKLGAAWNVAVQGVPLSATILLRRAT